MGRRKKIDRPVGVHVRLPESVVAKLSLALYSEFEGRVPTSARQRFFIQAINDRIDGRDKTFDDTRQALEAAIAVVRRYEQEAEKSTGISPHVKAWMVVLGDSPEEEKC